MGFNGDLYPSGGASVVMTTSGDMVKYESGARARLAIGSANQLLQVKSSLPSWETVDLADTVLTTAGDVLYENNTPELARLPKGTDADVLTLASGLPSWSAPAGGGATLTEIAITGATANQTTTSTSPVSPTGTTSATLSNISGGKVMGILYSCSENTGVGAKTRFFIKYDSAEQAQVQSATPISEYVQSQTLGFTTDLDGGTIEIMWEVSASTGMIQNDVDASTAIIALEIS